MLKLAACPPAVNENSNGTDGGERHEKHRILRKVAHQQRNSVSWLHAVYFDKRAGQLMGASININKTIAFVLIDNKISVPINHTKVQNVAQVSGAILKNLERHAPDHLIGQHIFFFASSDFLNGRLY